MQKLSKEEEHKLVAIQQELVRDYRVSLEPSSPANIGIHANARARKVCGWNYGGTYQNTIALLHEIGRIETFKFHTVRALEEYRASQWAINKANELGVKVYERTLKKYQSYIDKENARAVRRGCEDITDKTRLVNE